MCKVFVYKEENTESRDAVKYAEISNIGKFDDGKFRSFELIGACFTEALNPKELEKKGYDNIISILTKTEFKALARFNAGIRSLGEDIKTGDKQYNRGLKLVLGLQPILDKLSTPENKYIFEDVIREERELLQEKYGFNSADIDLIFEASEYKDRAVIAAVFDNEAQAARNGVCEKKCIKLSDNRIILLNR